MSCRVSGIRPCQKGISSCRRTRSGRDRGIIILKAMFRNWWVGYYFQMTRNKMSQLCGHPYLFLFLLYNKKMQIAEYMNRFYKVKVICCQESTRDVSLWNDKLGCLKSRIPQLRQLQRNILRSGRFPPASKYYIILSPCFSNPSSFQTILHILLGLWNQYQFIRLRHLIVLILRYLTNISHQIMTVSNTPFLQAECMSTKLTS